MKNLIAGLMLLLGSQLVLADGPCPDGQFNQNDTVCICPGGGWVAPNQYCNGGSSNRGGRVLPPDPEWGSIAIDTKEGWWGYSPSKRSQSDADTRALRRCGTGSTCKVVLRFKNSCGAIASGKDNTWGGGVDVSEKKALQKAADACYDRGVKECRAWVQPKCAGAPR